MVNYIPKYGILVVVTTRMAGASQTPHDLRVELSRCPCVRVSIRGTPDNLAALSDYPKIERLTLDRCDIPNLDAVQGLSRLRESSVDLSFCSGTLEMLELTRLRRLKDLSKLPLMPKLEYLEISHIHSLVPPDFRSFPNLRHLSIWNTEWQSLSWLAHLPVLETLHISQIKVKDKDWKPILNLKRLRHLHGMQNVFHSAACKEFMRLRPDVRVDQGIPASPEKDPHAEEFMEKLLKKKRNSIKVVFD